MSKKKKWPREPLEMFMGSSSVNVCGSPATYTRFIYKELRGYKKKDPYLHRRRPFTFYEKRKKMK